MIIKEMTMSDNKKYTIGFKEIKSGIGSIIECHILKKVFLCHISIYKKEHLKGLNPDYQQLAFFTVCEYEQELEQKEKLINAVW